MSLVLAVWRELEYQEDLIPGDHNFFRGPSNMATGEDALSFPIFLKLKETPLQDL